MNLSSTIGLEELVWALIALVGIYLAQREYREASADRKRQRDSGRNGAMRQWADFQVLMAYSFAVVFAGFFLVGAIAMAREPSPDSRVFSRLILAGGLIVCEALLANILLRIKIVRAGVRDELQRLRSHDSYKGPKKRRTDT